MSSSSIVPLFYPFGCRRDLYDLSLSSTGLFGTGLLEDDFLPVSTPMVQCYSRPRRLLRQNSGLAMEAQSDPNRFKVMLDVNQFSPEEITVKTIDNTVVVQAKHEEKLDEHGYVSRQFQRRYVLPVDVELPTVTSSLSHDGILTVEAPRKRLEAPKTNERVVPIVRKDTPAVAAKEPATTEPQVSKEE